MSQLTPPSTAKYQSGQPAFGTDVLGDLNTIYTDYNGGITDYNINASAAIANAKLAQITTAGKVSGAALTSLTSVPSGAGIIPVANIDTGTIASKIVILDGFAKLPAVDGSALTAIGTTWADYFSTSTIVGWAATPTGFIRYKKIGSIVFVKYNIDGTSNATNATFTVPYAIAGGTNFGFGYAYDAGAVAEGIGIILITTGGSTITLKTPINSGWSATGNKNTQGEFFYETT